MPNLKLTDIGQKMNRLTGVREIMKDIAETILSDPSKHWLNLSPGNPIVLPEVEQMWREYSLEVVNSDKFGGIVGRYGMTQGYDPFIEAVVDVYNKHYNWGITRKNVLITAGSQSLYFFATNLFAGLDSKSGRKRKILIPLCPEYTGYDGVVLADDSLISFEPSIEILAENEFKYGVNFDNLEIDESIGAILCSRPCNPTGNILTDSEVSQLLELAKANDIPLIIDSAYAPPFPNLVYTEMTPIYDEHIIHCVSLSKAGLPGERVAMAIGHEKYISALEPFLSNVGIHSSRFGQAIAGKAINSGRLAEVADTVIKPFYRKKLELFRDSLKENMPNNVNWYIHKVEGSLFSWVWIDHEAMNDLELYQKLKAESLIAVPGSTFFPGLMHEWQHKHQCLRFSMTASDEDIVAATKALGTVSSNL